MFIPTCVDINTITVLTNFTNCYEDLPVIVSYLSTNFSAFLTTDLIIRHTSRIINCNQIISRYFDLPDSKILLKQTKNTVERIARQDVLWTAIDTNNINLQRSNMISHYHGILDGLDVLSARPEYTDFHENGHTFVALDREPDPLTTQNWWVKHKWYFYGTALVFASLILVCSCCWICTCANCWVPKFFCNPCISCYHLLKSHFRKKQHFPHQRASSTNETDHKIHESSTPNSTNEVQFMSTNQIEYQITPTIQEIQEIQPFLRTTATRSSSERSRIKRYSRQLRVFK